jgi:predicted HAD superfamily Cof-like phosphohydrolase
MAGQNPDRPTIVCVCGSTKYRAEILRAVRAETLEGKIVLSPGVFSHANGEHLNAQLVSGLTKLHEQKIRLADEVLIVDVDGRVGDATAREADLAASLSEPVRYWSKIGEASRATHIDPEIALRESHRVQHLVTNDVPTLDVPAELKELRCALIEEEAAEFRDALEANDIVGVADAIADLLYGAALTFGIPATAVFSEVHRSNMTKLDEHGEPILRADGKVMKGPNFSPPNLAPILREHGYTS